MFRTRVVAPSLLFGLAIAGASAHPAQASTITLEFEVLSEAHDPFPSSRIGSFWFDSSVIPAGGGTLAGGGFNGELNVLGFQTVFFPWKGYLLQYPHIEPFMLEFDSSESLINFGIGGAPWTAMSELSHGHPSASAKQFPGFLLDSRNGGTFLYTTPYGSGLDVWEGELERWQVTESVAQPCESGSDPGVEPAFYSPFPSYDPTVAPPVSSRSGRYLSRLRSCCWPRVSLGCSRRQGGGADRATKLGAPLSPPTEDTVDTERVLRDSVVES